MPFEFNWNVLAYEMSPISQYSDLYSNQTRIYMFEGTTLVDLILLLLAAVLSIFWSIIVFHRDASLTKSMIVNMVIQIFVCTLVRFFKVGIILLIQYPQFSWLFVASSVETVFHYALLLEYTALVLFYMLFRDKYNKSSWPVFYSAAAFVAVALLASVLNVCFNELLSSFPFYIYVIVYVGLAVSNVIILIAIVAPCSTWCKQKIFDRWRMFFFVLATTPPTIFNIVINIMDLFFMVVGVAEKFPIPYVLMTTYRYKVFEATPIFVLIAFFALIPYLRRSGTSRTTTVAEVTSIVTEPASVSGRITDSSEIRMVEAEVPIPNRIDPISIVENAPVQTYGNQNYGMGVLVVHIKPLSNS